MNDKFALLDASDSVLLVIDVQDPFLHKVGTPIANRVVERIQWLVVLARWMEIPVVVTAEDISVCGLTTEPIRKVLPGRCQRSGQIGIWTDRAGGHLPERGRDRSQNSRHCGSGN